MTRNTDTFEINLNGMPFIVERGITRLKVYRLASDHGTYLIAKDFYGVWVELYRVPGSVNISLNEAGKKIEEHCVISYIEQ